MDLNKAKELKAATEQQIEDLLNNFHLQTGLFVEGVRLQIFDQTTCNGERKVHLGRVELEVKI